MNLLTRESSVSHVLPAQRRVLPASSSPLSVCHHKKTSRTGWLSLLHSSQISSYRSWCFPAASFPASRAPGT